MRLAARARDAAFSGHHREAASLYKEALLILYQLESHQHGPEAERPADTEAPHELPRVADDELPPESGVANTVSEPARTG